MCTLYFFSYFIVHTKPCADTKCGDTEFTSNFSLLCRPGMKPKKSIEPDNCLVQMRRMIYWWKHIVILALVIAVTAWTVYNHNEQEQKMSAMNQKMSELNQKMSEQGQKITEQNQKMSEQGQTITELSQKMSEQGQKITELSQKMSEQGQKITELSQKMSEQGQTITEQNQKITELSRNMSEWGKKITELQQQLVQEEEWRGAVARISEVEDRMMQLKEDWIEGMHRVLENISHQNLNLTKQIDHINITKADQHDVDLLKEKVTSLSTTTTTEKVYVALKEIIQTLIKSKGDPLSFGVQLIWNTSKFFLS